VSGFLWRLKGKTGLSGCINLSSIDWLRLSKSFETNKTLESVQGWMVLVVVVMVMVVVVNTSDKTIS
jgi:hypothetical protein